MFRIRRRPSVKQKEEGSSEELSKSSVPVESSLGQVKRKRSDSPEPTYRRQRRGTIAPGSLAYNDAIEISFSVL